ncbi:hypothetical protein LUZ60_016374 [Juncus effusus]|nr:hypothetical protein LUZ60_016374 [Juncus effusus]
MGIEVLTEVNEEMSRWASATIVGLTSNVMKRLTRHQEILHELMQEFKRTRKNLLTVREHAELLNSVRNDINEYKGSSGVQLEPNLLRERAAIHGSVTHIDEVTGKAEILRGVLTDQRSAFGEIQGKMKHISDKFPVIRVTIGAIKRKKSRDTIILLAVSAVCTLFLVIYSISK